MLLKKPRKQRFNFNKLTGANIDSKMQKANSISCALDKDAAALYNGLTQMQGKPKNKNKYVGY